MKSTLNILGFTLGITQTHNILNIWVCIGNYTTHSILNILGFTLGIKQTHSILNVLGFGNNANTQHSGHTWVYFGNYALHNIVDILGFILRIMPHTT